MENNSLNSVIEKLKQMIGYCQIIQELLQKDQNYFLKNDVPSINQSNQEKSDLIEKLNLLASDLNQVNLPGGLLKTFRQVNSNLDEIVHQALQENMSELKTQINQCYKHIMVNSTVISANMKQLKEIWDKILNFKAEKESLYDHTGSPVR